MSNVIYTQSTAKTKACPGAILRKQSTLQGSRVWLIGLRSNLAAKADMPIIVDDRGSGNRVEIPAEILQSGTGQLVLTGNNASVTIRPVRELRGILNITLGENCHLAIGQNCIIGQVRIHAARSATIEIGDWVRINGACEISLHEPSRVSIGERCLIAGGTILTTSDMHSIIDAGTGRRINPACDIVVEPDVWIGARAIVLKGVRIGTGSIIGMAAVVTRDVPPRCAAAGNPARVIRQGVTWRGDLIPCDRPG